MGAIVGRVARRWAPGVRVYFQQGMWVHREGDVVFVDSPALDYHPSAFRAWANELDRCAAAAAEHWFHVYRPQPGDVIVDVGAGKGEDTIVFSQAVGPAGRVIAIEAHPATFRCLRLFCKLNQLDNVQAMESAIVDRAGPVAIESKEEWQANSIGTGDIQVPGITLDEAIDRAGVKHIDFLKMNIEGAEIRAVQGMDRTFRITRALCVSCHDFRANEGDEEPFRTKAAIREAVRRAGFRIIPRDTDERPYISDQVNGVRD